MHTFLRALGLLGAILAPLSLAGAQACPNPVVGPDVIVGSLSGLSRYGFVGDKTGYSIGTTSCNVGDTGLLWISNNNQHPVIGQNIYRLENNRFEQLGQSWLKHGFTALQLNLCCDCAPSGSGSILGVGCSDPYSSGLNGSQGGLGPRWEVNPSTGNFNYPFTSQGQTGNNTYKRIQVRTDDLSPILHPTALYFGEGQYVTPDDAAAGNHFNNASYRRINVGSLTSTGWSLLFSGSTFREEAAIYAWRAQNPAVQIEEIFVPGDGLIIVASLATQNLDSTWHYEYAVFNQNSNRAGGSFSVPAASGLNVTNVGFHDVDAHSGDPYSNADWVGQHAGGNVSWATEPHSVNPFANPIRWGTLYNFRFDASTPPTPGQASLGLFLPGAPASMSVSVPVPSDPVGCAVTSYCQTSPNSIGPGALMSHVGTTSIAANDFTLVSAGAKPNQFGLFYYGPNQVQIPFGDGFRCVGGGAIGTFRLNPVALTNGVGVAMRLVDLTAAPAASGPGAITSGSTWNFQHWYRDPVGGPAGFNFSDGLSATFCP